MVKPLGTVLDNALEIFCGSLSEIVYPYFRLSYFFNNFFSLIWHSSVLALLLIS